MFERVVDLVGRIVVSSPYITKLVKPLNVL